MKIIENNILPPRGYKAITILNMIFVRKGVWLSDTDIRHESIHYEQEKELAFVGFYLLYVLEFLFRLIKAQKWHQAYRSISFEKECYDNEEDLDYLQKREHYHWIKYLKRYNYG